MMEYERSSSTRRSKTIGIVSAAIILVVVGVVALNNANDAQVASVEHAEMLAQADKTPLSQLPEESTVQTPQGWEIESDDPVAGDDSEEVTMEADDEFEQAEEPDDDDIYSPMQIEQDENGEEYVAELADDVMVEGDENANPTWKKVEEDRLLKCYQGAKRCGAKRACRKKCSRRCRPWAVRKCKHKKFCRCFCKYKGNTRKARKCVIYKKKTCKKVLTYRCKRTCQKFCKKVPHCYCCSRSRVSRRCRKFCRRFVYKSKCPKCRCRKIKCYKTCTFMCKTG